MNKGIFVWLTVIPLLLMTLPASARSKISNLQNANNSALISIDTEISPFELVYRGYQGRYHVQGVNGYASFIEDIRMGKIKSKKLVEAAITAGDLPEKVRSDQTYLNYVDFQLGAIK